MQTIYQTKNVHARERQRLQRRVDDDLLVDMPDA